MRVDSILMTVLLAMALFSSPKVLAVTHSLLESLHQSSVGTSVTVGPNVVGLNVGLDALECVRQDKRELPEPKDRFIVIREPSPSSEAGVRSPRTLEELQGPEHRSAVRRCVVGCQWSSAGNIRKRVPRPLGLKYSVA